MIKPPHIPKAAVIRRGERLIRPLFILLVLTLLLARPPLCGAEGPARQAALIRLLAQEDRAREFIASELGSPRPERRLLALSLVLELGALETGDKETGPRILGLLDDPNPRVRRRAALVLGRLGHLPARPVLERRLAQGPEPALARALICGLGLLGDPGSAPALRPWLDHPEPLVRIDAASALAALGDPRGWPLVLAGSRDPDPGFRLEAVYGLRFFPTQGARERLEEMVRDPGETWRREAGVSLAALTSAALAGDPPAREGYLIGLLESPNPLAAEFAVEALARLDSPGARDALEALAERPTRLGRAALRKLAAGGNLP